MSYAANIQAYAELSRPQSASGSILTYSIGYLMYVQSFSIDFVIGLALLLLLHSYATVQNDIADFEIDKANSRSSILQDSKLSPYNAQLIIQALVGGALLLALLTPHRKLHLLLMVGLYGLSWLYNEDPFRASKKPIASIVLMGICYGTLPFVYGYLLAGGKPAQNHFLLLAICWGLARMSTALMKDYKDAAGDALFNKKTFYLRYGRKRTGWTSIILSVIAYMGVLAVVADRSMAGVIFYVVLLMATLFALQGLLLRRKSVVAPSEKQLNRLFQKTVLRHNQFEGAVVVCLLLSSK